MGVATAAVRPVLLSLGRGSWKLARGQLHHRPVSSGEPFFTISSHTYIHPVAKLSSSSSCPNRDGRDGDCHTVRARLGDNLLEVAREYDIDLEGACDGTLACSTCHLVVDPEWFPKITDPLSEEEEDMLDLAYGLTDTSRLGCQVVVTEDLDGVKLNIPMATLDARET
jgi:2Fe-2S ferredoxin